MLCFLDHRNSSGCKRISSWTDYLHYSDHSTVSGRELGFWYSASLLEKRRCFQWSFRVSMLPSVTNLSVFGSTRDVNTAIMELLIMAYALKTSCAKNIIGVIPYFPYSKQCKMRKRGSIVSKLLASMLAKAGKADKMSARECGLRSLRSSTVFVLCRFDTHHHHGLAPEGDPGFLHLPSGQPARLSFPDSVHPGRGDSFIHVCVNETDSDCIQDPCSFAPSSFDVTHIYLHGGGPPSPNHTGQIYSMWLADSLDKLAPVQST